jgi:hypothetical protein
LKHSNATVIIYISRQMKHLEHASETLEKKTPKNTRNPLQIYATSR